jgi:hypothetical protein
MVFDHCDTPDDVWRAFHELACLCHPAQGGSADDMRALSSLARQRLGDAWPAHWTDMPNVFDVYCRATGTPNPFGRSVAEGLAAVPPPPPDVPGYDADDARAFAWLPAGAARVRLAYVARERAVRAFSG